MNRFYRLIRGLARLLMALLFPVRAEGAHFLPPEGPVILCGNHISLRDPVAVACAVDREVHFMAKKELFSTKLFGRILRALNAFPVDRGAADLSAMRAAFSVLKQDEVLGIFPQGTRDLTGKGIKMENGVSMIALRSRAPVVPVLILGPYRLFRPIRLIFGPPVDLSEFAGRIDSANIKAATQQIGQALWTLAPATKN